MNGAPQTTIIQHTHKKTPTPTPLVTATPTPTTNATFQGLGQMPGVLIQSGSCGTQAFGISGDGNVIVGAGCVPSSQPGGFVDQAFRWTVTCGYHRPADL